jgi:hypothetical protein
LIPRIGSGRLAQFSGIGEENHVVSKVLQVAQKIRQDAGSLPSLESPTYTGLRIQHLRILRASSIEHKWLNYYER